MEKLNISKQTKEKIWKDEAGIPIPAERVSKAEKLRETLSFDLAKKALKLNEQLTGFKDEMKQACDAVVEAVRAEAKLAQKENKETKGNFTWFNFNRSLKVEQTINEQIAFDDIKIALCKEKLDEFLNRAMHGSDNAEMISQLVKDAFSTTRGKLDAKKVMSLLKYEDKIESILYKDAMKFLRESIHRPGSKTYYRVSIKKEDGSYEPINLNISSI